MGNRGSKSIIIKCKLAYLYINKVVCWNYTITVKEQRVDGSLVILILVLITIRYTLVAGKSGSWKKLSNSRLKIPQ